MRSRTPEHLGTHKLSEHIPFASLLERIGEVADRIGIEAYAVGGFVRDVLLGRKTTDIDFVTVGEGTGIRLAEELATDLKGGIAHIYPNFGTAAVRLEYEREEMLLEFVGARRESYRKTSRNPIVEEGTLEDDQRRRDFTINAMAIALNLDRFGELLDPFDGRADLENRLLRTPANPHETFEDDPLRMIRAARFAAQLEFRIDVLTFEAMKEKAARIEIISQERITDELRKIVCSNIPSTGFKVLFQSGILQLVFPELTALAGVETVDGYGHKDNFYHTLQVLDNLVSLTAKRPCEETEWLRWAAILHDIAKPQTKRFSKKQGWTFHGHEDRGARLVPRIFKRLRLPHDERMKYTQKLVRLHHRPVALVDDEVTDSAVRRLLFDAGDSIEDLMTLVRADITSKNPRRVERYLSHFDRVEEKMEVVEEKDRLRNFKPPVDGNEIMNALGLPPGPEVGRIKKAIEEAILEGKIPNQYEAAHRYMMEVSHEILGKQT